MAWKTGRTTGQQQGLPKWCLHLVRGLL